MIENEQKDAGNLKQEEVLITHVFDASRELVFRAWTEPEQLIKWYAPEGCTITFKQIDVRKGGRFHSCIYNPTYGNCWCKGTYLELDFPERIVFTMEVTDEAANDVQPTDVGMSPDWPAVTKVTVTFEELGAKTKMVLHQTVPASLAKETGAYPSWIQMFNRLNQMLCDD